TVIATAGDNTGVVGVQLRLDGADLGAQLTATPYSLAWDTTTVADGSHTLTAVARDGAGNTTVSAAVTLTTTNNAMLTIATAGTGSGAVTTTPAGIACPGTCQKSYRLNTVVALTAAPAARSSFGGWSGDTDCSVGQVTMSRAKRCTATVSAFRITCYMPAGDPTPAAGTAVGFRDVAGLAAGATSLATTTLLIPAAFNPGPYYLSAMADSGGALQEVDETNNGRTAAATI